MGRRKIEIRPIKDDRNRSVTFLKRKGGLFKKAYELGVLCSVDVAVIIFGHNKKLYEYSSGDINDTIGRFQYYAGAHEHKGPEDFAGKGGGDDDEDEDGDMGSPPRESTSPPDPSQMTHHNLHHQPGLQHMRHAAPSASPPMPNGGLPMQHRASPQPAHLSRPNSRTATPRRPSNLAPPQYGAPQAQMAQPAYAYGPGQQYYQQQSTMSRGQPSPPYPPAPQPHMQNAFPQDQRSQSGPPAYSQQHPIHQHPGQPHHTQPHPGQQLPGQSHPHPSQQHPAQPPVSHQHQGQQIPRPHPSPQARLQQPETDSNSRRHTPQQLNNAFQSPPLPQPKSLPHSKSNSSIFTPIEDSRSLLAQHWGAPPTTDQPVDRHPEARPQSVDTSKLQHDRANGFPPPPPPPQSSQSVHPVQSAPYPGPSVPHRTNSASSSRSLAPQSRSNTMQTEARRPRLKVQIPSEASDSEATGDLSAGPGSLPPAKSVVLPPPSPSAGNPLLSAGATGPPNPFARPAPPTTQALNRDMETPLSALPSRVMEGNMLPSPSDIWGSMFSRSNNDNMMPSPLNFQPTPIAATGSGSFRGEDAEDRKRKAEADVNSSNEKRVRT